MWLQCCWEIGFHDSETCYALRARLFLSASFLCPFFTLQHPRIVSFIASDTTSITSHVHGRPRVKGHMHNSLETLALCVQVWLFSRLL